MQDRNTQGMWGRYALFIFLSFAILLINIYVMSIVNPPKPRGQRAGPAGGMAAAPADVAGGELPVEAEKAPGQPQPPDTELQPGQPGPAEADAEKPAAEPAEAEPEPVVEQPEIPPQWVTLGSLDPSSGHRMLVTLTNRGAAVVRIELNGHRFHNLEDRSGYLGQVVMDETAGGDGCPVHVVGPGTPAAEAGLIAGDLITKLGEREITGFRSLRTALLETKPKQTVTLTVSRQGEERELPKFRLRHRPLEVVRPEAGVPLNHSGGQLHGLRGLRPDVDSPLSFLCTLSRLDDQKLDKLREELDDLKKKLERVKDEVDQSKKNEEGLRGEQLTVVNKRLAEIKRALSKFRNNDRDEGIAPAFDDLRVVDLEISKIGQEIDELKRLHLEIDGVELRSGNWEVVPGNTEARVAFRRVLPKWNLEITKTYWLGDGYDLGLKVEVRNTGETERKVAYQLDGPNGLPTEGYWYANKIGRRWGAVGLRDVAVSVEGDIPDMIPCAKIAGGDLDPPWQDKSLTFVGVDAQYFAAVMIPQKGNFEEIWFAESQPLLVGPVDPKWTKLANTSCRMVSTLETLGPGDVLSHSYEIFVGPKKPALLAEYGLEELVYYGWFGWIAKFLLGVLHMFYALVRNYGLAILMLTVLVRSCMFPLSKKQALGAQKMAELQPEIRKIQEKYKKDMEARTKAQQELFKKHNYNPLSGCLVLFLQLPIFIGLYRGLMVDVELRQAPLISESIRWCSNLAAPDMFLDWSGFMPAFVTSKPGFFMLGPYLNLLPILTIVLFLMQQKMLMPPPADDQAAMQQNVMKFMMIFMGIIFFKVASGLCIYFIASTLWGLAERQLLPKRAAPASDDGTRQSKPRPARAPPRAVRSGDGAAARKKRTEGDGAPAAKKKKKKSRGKR